MDKRKYSLGLRKMVLVVLALVSAYVSAVPVVRHRAQVQLVDGRTVWATIVGDEHHSWWQTDDGVVVQERTDGLFELTERSSSDERRLAQTRRATALQRAPRRVGSQASAPLPAKGSPKVPVVLVNFTDSVFTVGSTDDEIRRYYDLYCNGTRDGQPYREHGSYGSIRDYFSDQSDGQFTPEFVIIGPVTLDNPEFYYGANSSTGKDIRYSQFRTDAVGKATDVYEGSWADFDNRGRSTASQIYVDMVFFIFAGCGENSSYIENTLWPKESSSGVTINGIRFATSACCSERRAITKNRKMIGTESDGIGVMCHELSHALGLPDLYDTSYKAFGMDLWSLMDYGCYGQNGFRPSAYTAYEREFMGWKQIPELTSWQSLTLQPIAAGGTGYRIINDENPDEYYIIENRQEVGWDGGICQMGHGLQVTHVDYDAVAWNRNAVNTDSIHQRMTIIAANNRYIGTSRLDATPDDFIITWAGNLYPYIYTDADGNECRNDALTSTTTPAATVFSKSGFMNKDLHAITEHADQSVTLYYGNDYDPTVGIAAPEQLKADVTPLYDLAGRRRDAAHLPAGIYIRDGRKLLVR